MARYQIAETGETYIVTLGTVYKQIGIKLVSSRFVDRVHLSFYLDKMKRNGYTVTKD